MIRLIHKSVSLCNICYRHIPANIYEKDGKILMAKKCHEHGIMSSIVEVDTEFYHSMNYINLQDGLMRPDSVLFEITDRCNLQCPHCYHLPDNKTKDLPLEDILSRTFNIPANCQPIYAGAEPTMRRDFCDVVAIISKKFPSNLVLTNGLKFSDKKFTRQVKEAGLTGVILGLNHWSYQGQAVHNRQLEAIENVLNEELWFPYVGYTIESLDHVAEILEEIDRIHIPNSMHQYRIRCGSFIGRSSDKKRSYVSNTVKKIKEILGNDVIVDPNADNNIYHYNMIWNDKKLRIIQWPDVTNIDMEELNCDPYCYFYDGPITNFVHQVITRDFYINKGIAPLDRVPIKYQHYTGVKPYWRDHWSGTIDINDFDWNYDADDMRPREIIDEPRQRIIRAVSTG